MTESRTNDHIERDSVGEGESLALGGAERERNGGNRRCASYHGVLEWGQTDEPFFAAHGFGAVARAPERRAAWRLPQHGAQSARRHGRTFVAVGKPEKVRERVDRPWAFADSLCPVATIYARSGEKLAFYSEQIAQTFAA